MKRCLIPAVILLIASLGNRLVVAGTELSPWDLAGFGMFSSIDAPHTRIVRVTVESPTGETALLMDLAHNPELVDQLRVWPNTQRAQALATQLQLGSFSMDNGTAFPDSAGDQPASVKVEVFSTHRIGEASDPKQTQLETKRLVEAVAS